MPKASPAKTKQPRRFKQQVYKSFRPSPSIKSQTKALPSAFKITKKSTQVLKNNWRLFLVITLIYGLLTIVLVRGFGGSLNLAQLKDTLKAGFNGSFSNLFTGLTLFGYLLGSAGTSSNPAGGVYQGLLIIILSLVTIWALRQVMAGQKIKAKQAFYSGTYPLVQFILVLSVIGLQLLPLLIGSWVYSNVVSSGIAVTGAEKFIWGLLAILLAVLSLYMLASSIFALYIVTLPDMTPMKALRSARQLVLHRRWKVLIKILFLPLLLLIIGAAIMVPLILLATALAQWIFFGLTMFVLIAVHGYMYSLYRELL